jgi:diacylglycerol kinase family enzyme
MRVAVIINPISGGRRRAAAIDRRQFANAWLAARSITGQVELTTHHGHAIELARTCVHDGCHRVVAWGGDGTANEVAGPLIGTNVVFGLVPAGSGDGLARGLGLPSDPAAALDLAVGDSVLPLDVGWLGDRHFLNVAGFGFDAAVAQAFQDGAGRGFAGYLLAGMSCLWSYRNATYELDLDGDVSRDERFLVAFSNGSQYGNDFVLAADGNPFDGWLDAVVIGRGSILQQIWRGRSFLLKKVLRAKGVLRRRVRRAIVSGTDLRAHVDGEPFRPASPVSIRVEAAAIRLAAAPRRPGGG